VLVLAGNQDEIGIATALQQMWGAIGIKLELQQVDNATPHRTCTGPARSRCGSAPDRRHRGSERDRLLLRLLADHRRSHSGWKNEEVDKLFEASQKETDSAKRAEQYAKIQEIFNATGPIVPLYETPYPVALNKKVKGFIQIPLGNNIFAATSLEK
jgi:peptide/nickel transport system substrate-binding protein